MEGVINFELFFPQVLLVVAVLKGSSVIHTYQKTPVEQHQGVINSIFSLRLPGIAVSTSSSLPRTSCL